MRIIKARLHGEEFSDVLVDDDDYDMVSGYTWRINTSGHVQTVRLGKTILMHRLVMGISDPKCIIDYRDRNKFNCQKYNLRCTDVKGNARNRTSIGKSGHIGISIENNKYRVRIKVDNRNIHIGYFKLNENGLKDAINARKQAELKYWRKIDNE